MGAMSDVDDDVPLQPVYQAAAPREQQQLRVVADEDSRMAFGEVAPEHCITSFTDPRDDRLLLLGADVAMLVVLGRIVGVVEM